jgi:isocitrate dehydrogenase
MIVDIAAALLADRPQDFDVIVTLNLYGDILSDIAAQVTGSVGLGGSANIGDTIGMFEAIHGSAPMIAGKDLANPSGLLLGAVQMLMHVQARDTATLVYDAWLRTIEDGVHTGDLFKEGISTRRVGTTDFTAAVIDRLGQKPVKLRGANFDPVPLSAAASAAIATSKRWVAPAAEKRLSGVDVFVNFPAGAGQADKLAARLQAATAAVPSLKLTLITSRGVKCWPDGFPETFTVDHWRCRFRPAAGGDAEVAYKDVLAVMSAAHEKGGLDVIKSENLCLFRSEPSAKWEPGFSMGQGE